MLNHKLKTVSHRGVILRGEYAYFLRFQIRQRFNNLIINYNSNNWSEEQQKTHDTIKSLHETGMGYRKISYYLNEQGKKHLKQIFGMVIMFTQF